MDFTRPQKTNLSCKQPLSMRRYSFTPQPQDDCKLLVGSDHFFLCTPQAVCRTMDAFHTGPALVFIAAEACKTCPEL